MLLYWSDNHWRHYLSPSLNLLYTSVWSTQQLCVMTRIFVFVLLNATHTQDLYWKTQTVSQKSVHYSTHCSSPTASRLQLKGSHAKSMMLVPWTKVGMTPSGSLPVLLSSNTAILPPGPLSGTATLSGLAAIQCCLKNKSTTPKKFQVIKNLKYLLLYVLFIHAFLFLVPLPQNFTFHHIQFPVFENAGYSFIYGYLSCLITPSSSKPQNITK